MQEWNNHTIPHPVSVQWDCAPLIAQHCIGGTQQSLVMKSLIINKENFPKLNVTLSAYKTTDKQGNKYVDRNGNEFGLYWMTLRGSSEGDLICCTGSAITELLGTNANDDTAKDVLVKNIGKFQVQHAEDDDNKPIFLENGEPLLQIIRVAHSVDVW